MLIHFIRAFNLHPLLLIVPVSTQLAPINPDTVPMNVQPAPITADTVPMNVQPSPNNIYTVSMSLCDNIADTVYMSA